MQADQLGLAYADVTRLANHDRDVTQESYLPASSSVMHWMAGFGKSFNTRHYLGRQQLPAADQAWSELKELAIEGLDDMRGSAGGQLATVLDGLDVLREVFLQDAVLKLEAYGPAV